MICYRGVSRRRERVARSIYARKARGGEGVAAVDAPRRLSSPSSSRGYSLKTRRGNDTCSTLSPARFSFRGALFAHRRVLSSRASATPCYHPLGVFFDVATELARVPFVVGNRRGKRDAAGLYIRDAQLPRCVTQSRRFIFAEKKHGLTRPPLRGPVVEL